MSIRSQSSTGQSSRSANRPVYTASFRVHVHGLVQMGYQRLNPAMHAQSEEPEITGELVRAIRKAMEGTKAPRWVTRYAVHDDPPQNVNNLLGKKRPRVDIEFERTQRGPRPRYQFEAKRLKDNSSLSDYLGRDGLGCFLDGRYGVGQPEGGMLGYVQKDDESVWAEKLAVRLSGNQGIRPLRGGKGLTRVMMANGPRHTYQTTHVRVDSSEVTISHTFLRFC